MDLASEIEALEAIYPDEATIDKKENDMTCVKMPLRPLVPEGHDEFVRCLLCMEMSKEYPAVPLCVNLEDVVGLEEHVLADILENLKSLAIQHSESHAPAMFSIIENLRDLLTQNNEPAGDCCICLGPLNDEEDDQQCLKLCCSHCFHAECLARWIHDIHSRPIEKPADGDNRIATCPACRQRIDDRQIEAVALRLKELMAEYEVEAARKKEEEEEEHRQRIEEIERRRALVKQEELRIQQERFVPKPIIIISNLPKKMPLKILSHLVENFQPTDVRLVMRNGKFMKKGIATFGSMENAERAVSRMHMMLYENRTLQCAIATFADLREIAGIKF